MLKTEMRNEASRHVDKMSSGEMVALMQRENKNAADAIDTELERIAEVIDRASERMKAGGRLFYIGAGTSGRLGVLDASECPPTFGVSPETVIGIIAGGDGALRRAAEGAEDNAEAGKRDILSHSVTPLDTVVGISVAGGAEYVLGALRAAKEIGALTVAITSNAGSPLDRLADISICPDTGAEVITGSTRMKAGSAQKMILNMISTGVMVKLGHVYENLMINLKPSNIKLRGRMIGIVSEILGAEREESERLLMENGFSIRAAISAYEVKKNEG